MSVEQLKAALAKKTAKSTPNATDKKAKDLPGNKSQVMGSKPGKKSAGRGR